MSLVLMGIALPLCLSGSCETPSLKLSGHAAYAATRAERDLLQNVDALPEEEQSQYAGLLKELVVEKPDNFLQLIGQDIYLILDKPELERRDGDVVSWQYRTETCVLDLYFQAVSDIQHMPVMHYEIRDRRKALAHNRELVMVDNINPNRCLQGFFSEGDQVVASR